MHGPECVILARHGRSTWSGQDRIPEGCAQRIAMPMLRPLEEDGNAVMERVGAWCLLGGPGWALRWARCDVVGTPASAEEELDDQDGSSPKVRCSPC